MLFLFMIACGEDPADPTKETIPSPTDEINEPTDESNEPTNEIDCEDVEQLEEDDQVGDTTYDEKIVMDMMELTRMETDLPLFLLEVMIVMIIITNLCGSK